MRNENSCLPLLVYLVLLVINIKYKIKYLNMFIQPFMHYSIFVVLVRLFQCSSELKSHLCFWSSPAAGTSQSTLVCYPIGRPFFIYSLSFMLPYISEIYLSSMTQFLMLKHQLKVLAS